MQSSPSHLVLARTWRPRDFESLVGQDTVVRALRHALDTGRLHHAYLLTGTRGVGKTTIARIIAKALNCETGITSRPCGTCAACTGIDAGRFPDYLEMDAASNRKVEEMTSVLETAAYAPSVGRFKVFVIDEVHMLTNHAFNAMLKTLEEPPPHVTFVLATTDPQKVPVTVLSRCMQFGLRNMSSDAVAGHLEHVLGAERVTYERTALVRIAAAAGGSMRDALSLLDQAIAVGAGEVREADVRAMLGVVDDTLIVRLLTLLADAIDDHTGSGTGAAAVIDLADRMAVENAPFGQVLLAMARVLQRIAVFQLRAPAGRSGLDGAIVEQTGDAGDPAAAVRRLAQRLSPADVQVWYQVLVHGARDLPLAPDPATGFTMSLVRMIAFTTLAPTADAAAAGVPDGAGAGQGAAQAVVAGSHPPGGGRSARELAREAAQAIARPASGSAATARAGTAGSADRAAPVAARPARGAPGASGVPATARVDGDADADAGVSFDGDWVGLVARLKTGGIAGQLLQQSALDGHSGRTFRIRTPVPQLMQASAITRAQDALSGWFGVPVRLEVEVGEVGDSTAAHRASQARSARQAQAENAIQSDAFVRELIDGFGATIVPDSIKPLDSDGEKA